VHVIVVGCGRVGSELAGLLEKQGHTVAVVDKRKDAFRRLPTGFGGYRVVGFGFDRDTLSEAGIADAGALAAVTSGDNSNIMSAACARDLRDRSAVAHLRPVAPRSTTPRGSRWPCRGRQTR
jgi:trk system potassium uptake protein TrkA